MHENKLEGMRIAILVDDDFEQAEMTEPRKALEQFGAKTFIVSSQAGQVTGMNHDQKADQFPVDMTLDEARPDDFEGVLLPGGAINADHLRMNTKAQAFVRQMDQQGHPIAVICHAAWLLVSAGCVKGRTLTSYYTIQDDIRNAGGNWVDQQVVRDHNWVSSRSPQDLGAFDPAIVNLFADFKHQKPQDVLTA